MSANESEQPRRRGRPPGSKNRPVMHPEPWETTQAPTTQAPAPPTQAPSRTASIEINDGGVRVLVEVDGIDAVRAARIMQAVLYEIENTGADEAKVPAEAQPAPPAPPNRSVLEQAGRQ